MFLQNAGLSRRRGCALLGIGRSSADYRPRHRAGEQSLLKRLRSIALKYPRYGYRRAWALLRRDGDPVNLKRVLRLWRKAGLTLKRRRRRKRIYGKRPSAPLRALYPRHVVTYDFVQDRTSDGRTLRILTVVDEFTREALAIAVGRRVKAWDVIRVLAKAFARSGWPEYLRSDNGPEFIATALREWLEVRGVQTHYIDPGSPWQNAFGESFHDKLRMECLDFELFADEDEAQRRLQRWRKHYNEDRPHSSLEYLTPREFLEGWERSKGEFLLARPRLASLAGAEGGREGKTMVGIELERRLE